MYVFILVILVIHIWQLLFIVFFYCFIKLTYVIVVLIRGISANDHLLNKYGQLSLLPRMCLKPRTCDTTTATTIVN